MAGVVEESPEENINDCLQLGDQLIHGKLEIQQTQEERRATREGYRVLIDDLKKNKHDFIDPASDRLDEALYETDELYKNAKKSTERALDSMAVNIISSYGRQKAQALRTDFVEFFPEEFAEKLITFIGGPSSERRGCVKISMAGWKALGRCTQKLFSKSPTFHLLSGTFQRGDVEHTPKPVKVRQSKDSEKENRPHATIPKKLDSFDDSTDLGTTQQVARVRFYLSKYYESNENQPIPYFDFVVDPSSFGHTVENIFHTSFLIKNGWAKIELDEDRLPTLEPLFPERVTIERPIVKKPSHQSIISISPQDWKAAILIRCDMPTQFWKFVTFITVEMEKFPELYQSAIVQLEYDK